ncbi:Centrosomal protein of 89 kDa [Holothuria leucospilota]|uniref:Centrosomal protein of 89 kDa n=1 Tax=Holothuria leucospilota TaxID=206669 RepID=A0A9Q1CC69_HOLLE|nr:Centrosomal protein of 89 kDa [Holothuria leucospilota]
MLAAVPRSPEPPKEAPERRPPSALSSALMNATLVGRLIGTPPPNTGTLATERGPSPEEAPAENSLNNSMARMSMYDYGDSDDSDSEESEVDVPEEPRYASVPFRAEGGQKRSTISSRPRLDSPRDSEDSEDENEPVQDITPGRGSSRSNKPVLDSDRTTPGASVSGYEPPVYAKPKVVMEELKTQGNSQLSTDSDITEVTNPADDFSDLITPPPPWMRKNNSKKEEASKPKKTPRGKKSKNRQSVDSVPVKEEKIIPSRAEEEKLAPPPKALQSAPPEVLRNVPSVDEDFYNHIERLASAKSLQEHEFLRMTNGRLEKELEMVQKEREQLLETLKIQGQQMQEERRQSRTNSPVTSESPSGVHKLRELCDQLRDENSSIRLANDRLLEENQSLRETLKTPRDMEDDEEGFFVEQLKQRAEEVLIENDDLRDIIHKLNIQLSRYQAKCSPLRKGDPPGLPSRGSSPRWLTDTKYLSPLIAGYEDTLSEKEELLQQCFDDLEELRESSKKVINENQRLHKKLEDFKGTGSGYITPSEWQRVQEQAQLVLEENQVILEQLDISQDKLRASQKSHSLEVTSLNGRLATVESEKAQLKEEMIHIKSEIGALQEKYDSAVRESQQKLAMTDYLEKISEMKRTLEESQRQHTSEMEKTMARLNSVQSEKQELAIELTDMKAENTQLGIQVKALKKAQMKAQQKMSVLQQEVETTLSREQQANLHLNQVLEIAEKTAAERDSYAKMAKAQAQEKEKTVNKMMQGNIYVGKMEEKLKLYKHRAQEKLDSMSQEMQNQDSNYSIQVKQYEREIKHLQQIIREKQYELDEMTKDKRRVEEQLETVWQTAASDNQRIQAKLTRSLRPSALSGHQNGAFGSDSDNRGLLSSDSEA